MTPFETWFAFAMVAVIINTIILSRKPPKKSIVGVLFGMHLSFIGVLVFYIVYTTLHHNHSDLLIPTFISIYMIVTGLMISLYEYMDIP